MFELIFKNWKTSLFGFLIIIACFALVWFDKATLADVSAFIGVAIPFFFVKDEKVVNLLKKKTPPTLLLVFVGISLASCSPMRTIIQEHEVIKIDTIIKQVPVNITKVIQRTDTVFIKGDPVVVSRDVACNVSTKPIVLENQFSKAVAGVTDNIPWLELHAKEVVFDTLFYTDQISILKQQLKEVTTIKEKKPPWWQREWIIAIVVLGVGFLVLKKVFS